MQAQCAPAGHAFRRRHEAAQKLYRGMGLPRAFAGMRRAGEGEVNVVRVDRRLA
ncbi:MAG: hypothetical protein HY260_00855 [Chloroflexi bacterium]|nr:hypothetical protein [Chloroflexota bacterium]